MAQIHYNVWFSFKDDTVESDQVERVRTFLADLRTRGLVHDFQLLKNRNGEAKTKLPRFHALIVFRDEQQFGEPFAEVADIGVHSGRHGFMIEQIGRFSVEIFESI